MQQELVEHRVRGSSRSFSVNVAESPLAWLKARGLVSDRQFAAGEQLRLDYERAQLSPVITMTWNANAAIGSGRHDASDPSAAQIQAKRHFNAAIAAAGPGLQDILWRVVCACEPLPKSEKALGWPARSGRLVLGLALDRVASYYRI